MTNVSDWAGSPVFDEDGTNFSFYPPREGGELFVTVIVDETTIYTMRSMLYQLSVETHGYIAVLDNADADGEVELVEFGPFNQLLLTMTAGVEYGLLIRNEPLAPNAISALETKFTFYFKDMTPDIEIGPITVLPDQGTVMGNNDDNTIAVEDGHSAFGLDGDDYLFSDSDAAEGSAFIGGPGSDTLVGGYGDDLYVLTDTHDKIHEEADQGYDTVYSEVSFDLKDSNFFVDSHNYVEEIELIGIAATNLYGNARDNTLSGNINANILYGRDGNDGLFGYTGADTIKGGAGDDHIEGGNDDDSLSGDVGDDLIDGQSGNDIADGGKGADTVKGGDGNDTLSGGENADALYGGAGNDRVEGNNGRDELHGNNGNDRVIGGGGDDRIVGGAGNDVLLGGKGKDIILGGNGADRIIGGAKNDTLSGGDGNDIFVFADGFGNDLLTDFVVGTDMLDLVGWSAVSEFDDLKIRTYDDGIRINLIGDASDQIRIEGLGIGHLDARDFLFV